MFLPYSFYCSSYRSTMVSNPSILPSDSLVARIPNELYRRVFQYSAVQELITLCTVSRTTHHDAEKFLYRDVYLIDGNRYAWARTVTARRELARMALSLTLNNTNGKIKPKHYQEIMLADALRAAINIKSLRLEAASFDFSL